MTFEGFNEYQNNPQLFEALVVAFQLGGTEFKINFGKLMEAFGGETEPV
jgi:hypothetical protein